MKRRLFTILSAISLLMCVAVVAACVRSHWYEDRLHGGRMERRDLQCVFESSHLSYRQGNVLIVHTNTVFTFAREEDAIKGATLARAAFGRFEAHSLEIKSSSVPSWKWMGVDFSYKTTVPLNTRKTEFPFGERRALTAQSLVATQRVLTIPFWSVLLLLSSLPVLWLILRFRRSGGAGFPVTTP